MLLPWPFNGDSISEHAIKTEGGFLVKIISWIFDDMLKYILFTPFEIFKSAATVSLVLKFGAISAALVTILALFEGLKRIMSMEYTPMGTILRRYPIALTVSAFAPPLFYYAGMSVNKLVELVGTLTGSLISSPHIYGSTFQHLSSSIGLSFLTFCFMASLLFYLMKAFFYHAHRWFGLILNCVMTPIAMLSYTFKPYDHIAGGWLKDTMMKFGIQVWQSLLLSLVAIVLYAPNLIPVTGLEAFNSGLVRLMLAVGGMKMMHSPPEWLKRIAVGKGEDPRGLVSGIMKAFQLIAKLKGA